LTVDGKEYTQELKVISDPNLPIQSELTGLSEEYDVWTGDASIEESEEEDDEEAAKVQAPANLPDGA
jgi:hypothetical protein